MEVCDGDFGMENADGDIVPGVFSFGPFRFVGPSGDSRPGPTFSPALFNVGDWPERFEREFVEIGPVWVVPELSPSKIKGHDNK